MVAFEEMDKHVTIFAQMEVDTAPVILINTFTVAPQDVEQLLAAWTADADWMRQQPGYISAQLHRGVGGSCVFLNYAVWESMEDFKRAFTHHEFRARLNNYPGSAVASPHLFKKVAVPRICLG